MCNHVKEESQRDCEEDKTKRRTGDSFKHGCVSENSIVFFFVCFYKAINSIKTLTVWCADLQYTERKTVSTLMLRCWRESNPSLSTAAQSEAPKSRPIAFSQSAVWLTASKTQAVSAEESQGVQSKEHYVICQAMWGHMWGNVCVRSCECMCALGFFFAKVNFISTHTSIFTWHCFLFPGWQFLIKSVAASKSQFKHAECIYPFMTAEKCLIMNVSTWFNIVIYVCKEV